MEILLYKSKFKKIDPGFVLQAHKYEICLMQ